MGRTPELVDKFNAAMVELTRLVTPNILQSYDFSGIRHLMDVGGGSGELLGAIAQQNRKLRGTVFDLPRCAEAAGRHLRQIGIGDRVEFAAGDFFKAVPAIADAIILKSIIHDWNDTRSVSILQNCRKALPGGRQVAAGRTADAGDADHGGRGQGARVERSEHASRTRRAASAPRASTANCSSQSGFDLVMSSSSRPLQSDRSAAPLDACRATGCHRRSTLINLASAVNERLVLQVDGRELVLLRPVVLVVLPFRLVAALGQEVACRASCSRD